MKEKVMNFLKHRGVLSAVVAIVAGLAGYSSDKVNVEPPVFRVEVVNPTESCKCSCSAYTPNLDVRFPEEKLEKSEEPKKTLRVIE